MEEDKEFGGVGGRCLHPGGGNICYGTTTQVRSHSVNKWNLSFKYYLFQRVRLPLNESRTASAAAGAKKDTTLEGSEIPSGELSEVIVLNDSFPDESLLVRDLYRETWLSQPEHLCVRSDDVILLLVLVVSAPGNVAARNAIRHGWASDKETQVAVAFLVGASEERQTQVKILKHAYDIGHL